MANFVKSREYVQTTFTAGGTNTVNLTKGQDEAKCVPRYSMRFTAQQFDSRQSMGVKIKMVDNAGTPAVQVTWNPSSNSPTGDLTVDIFVTEYGSNVTVQQGSVTMTGTTATDTISAVTQSNSFIVFNQAGASGEDTSQDDFNHAFIQARFNSNTQIQFERFAALIDWDIEWYVVESDGVDFTTEYIDDSFTSTQTGPTGYTISSVTLNRAYLECTYEVNADNDDLFNAICNFAITAATTLTFYRNSGTTPAEEGNFGIWVVKAGGTEFDVQRFATTVDDGSNTVFDQNITAIDQARAMIVSSQNCGYNTWCIDASNAGGNIDDRQTSLIFFDDDTVRLERQQDTSIAGSNNIIRFEVVEDELEVAAGKFISLVDAGGLAGMGGLAGQGGGLAA